MLREKRRHANSKPNRKLDRKSSRGMIYENEELRLRTININAEVERGQSDIKKLRRENDHLRREIWSLRDEYDRLDKLLRNTQGLTNEQGGADRQPADRTTNYAGGEEEDEDEEDEGEEEEEEEDEEDDDEEEEPICEQCQQFEDACECSLPTGELRKISAATAFRPRPPPRHDKPNFDDLSVVSEETTHSADTNATDPDAMNRLSLNAPALGVFEYQSNVPPLAHFENLCYEKIGPNLNASGDLVFEGAHVSAERVDADFLLPSPPPPPLPRSPLPILVPEAFQDGGALSSPSPSIGPPDICMYSTSAPAPLRMRSRNGSGGSGSNGGGAVGRFSTGGNLEDLLHDLDNLSVEHSMHSSSSHGGGGAQTPKRKQRSEMNLVLTIDGDTTTISPVTPAAIPIQVDSPATVVSTPMAPPIGWKPELPPKPDKPAKPKFPWVSRSPGGSADRHALATAKSPPRSCMKTPTPPAPPPLSPLPQLQSAQQQMRRKSIPVVLDKQLQLQPQPHAAKSITATISKRRFSLRRNSDAASAGSGSAGGGAGSGSGGGGGAKLAIASGQAGASGGGSASGGGGPGGSSAERTTTHSVSSSPESSTSHRSQHPAAPARPQARRISTGSHDNATGSIPWCACWGNGCI